MLTEPNTAAVREQPVDEARVYFRPVELFDADGPHEHVAHEGLATPGFDFLNRSDHPEAQRVRTILESWFTHYPAADRTDLASRFRSSSRSQHQPAFFELFLHALLRALGCGVEIHPKIATTSKRPDFLAHEPEKGSFYLEAHVAMNESREAAGVRDQLDLLYKHLAEFRSPDFFVYILSVKKGVSAVPGAKRVKHFLNERLERASWESAQHHIESGFGLSTLPRWQFREEDWLIEFLAVPKSGDSRGRTDVSVVGMKMEGLLWQDPRGVIAEAVESKASKYGMLDEPLVVGVNYVEPADDNLDVFTAFYGSENWTVDIETAAATCNGFNRDGIWMGKGGPQNRRVSAVLVGYPVHPWNLTNAPFWLYQHPFALAPYAGVLTDLPRVWHESGKTYRASGKTLAEIFDLPLDWPRASR